MVLRDHVGKCCLNKFANGDARAIFTALRARSTCKRTPPPPAQARPAGSSLRMQSLGNCVGIVLFALGTWHLTKLEPLATLENRLIARSFCRTTDHARLLFVSVGKQAVLSAERNPSKNASCRRPFKSAVTSQIKCASRCQCLYRFAATGDAFQPGQEGLRT